MTEVSVASLAELVGGRLIGDGERRIVGLCDLRQPAPDRIGFVRHARYQEAARQTTAGALLSKEEFETPASLIVVADVDVAYAKVAMHFHPLPLATEHAVHPTASVHPEAELESPVHVGPNASVGRCRIGAGTAIMAGAAIGDGARLGRDCLVHANATVGHDVVMGDRVILQPNAVVGSDGFGYAREGATWHKVPQLGTVVLGDDVEVGSNSAIDRGTLGATRIGARTKLDNLVHIAHNCNIGEDVVMAAGAMVAGSTTLGDRCVLAGQVGISGHLKIAADCRFAGDTVVLRDVPEPGDYMGHPMMTKRRYLRLMRDQRRSVGDQG
ncbi:MAG: UDP-3-O-(3-hydroxymyristoyl)glucosamine N-acyltransferase [Planctomycetes bacterium]|nr:UDP-3-O-(3-hydroxymyristoyl)glucosamine N-acyltransferase [Planctomycetota bacterium]